MPPRSATFLAVSRIALILALTPLPALAGGVIQGQVLNAEDKQPVPHAQMILEAPVLGTALRMESDAQGNYRFADLAPGTYAVSAEAGAFRPFQRPNIPLRGDRTLRVNIELLPREFQSLLEAPASRP